MEELHEVGAIIEPAKLREMAKRREKIRTWAIRIILFGFVSTLVLATVKSLNILF